MTGAIDFQVRRAVLRRIHEHLGDALKQSTLVGGADPAGVQILTLA